MGVTRRSARRTLCARGAFLPDKVSPIHEINKLELRPGPCETVASRSRLIVIRIDKVPPTHSRAAAANAAGEGNDASAQAVEFGERPDRCEVQLWLFVSRGEAMYGRRGCGPHAVRMHLRRSG